MTELQWEDVAEGFALDGLDLRDIYVFGVAVDDWQALMDLVTRRWASRYTEDGDEVPVRSAADVFAVARERTCCLAFWPHAGWQVNAHFFDDEEIELDLEARYVHDQRSLDHVGALLRELGRELGRSVVLTHEDQPSSVVLRYRHDTDVVETAVRAG